MKLGRKIRKIKSEILYFLRRNINLKVYNFIILQLAKKKFLKSINSRKIILSKSNNLDKINNYEYKITSQNNEDGIIDYLKKNITNPDNFFFEIGFDFNEFNSLNLIKNNWSGALIDGDQIKCDKLKVCINKYFKSKKITIYNDFITYENINVVIANSITKKNFDFFSLDTDGMDYWILEKLEFNPKIICAEFNPWLGKSEKLILPKKLNFNYESDMYYGASLKAYQFLLNKKNYKLVAIESSGNNAFFINQHEFNIHFDELDIEKSFKLDPKFEIKTYEEVYQRLLKKEWVKL
ncbi:hypothetical protein OAP66_00100 [Candidatus Pelagibacter sp.]|nr:hypothetical protein [Candidatus Pelagibacter sp.]